MPEGHFKPHEIEQYELDDKPSAWDKKPIKIIMAIFLVLIIILWTYSFYGITADPRPTKIPTVEEVIPYKYTNTTKTNVIFYEELVTPTDPFIKQTANSIAKISCDSSHICYAKAMYYFIRDNYFNTKII